MKLDNKELVRMIDLVKLINTKLFKFPFLLNSNTKKLMWESLNNKTDFELDNKLEEKIIKNFISRKMIIKKDTPEFVRTNELCILSSIENEVTSIENISIDNNRIRELVIKKALENIYIIKENSPLYLKNNVDVIINSIKNTPDSANYVMWDDLNENDCERIISVLSKTEYTLSYNSPEFFTRNKEIIVNSIKNDPNSLYYVPRNFRNEQDILKALLLLNVYNANDLYNLNINISIFNDSEVIEWFFKNIIYKYTNTEENKNYERLITSIFDSKPLINNFYNIFELLSEIDWNVLKKDPNNNNDNYQNMFGKICGYLQNGLTYEESISEMKFINNMEKVLGEKYQELDNSMKEYFEIFNNNEIINKKETIKKSRDNISYLASLYVSKSKEIYKKHRINEYMELIKKYYKINLDNPEIKRILYFEKQWLEFQNLVSKKDENVLNLVKSIKEKNNFEIAEGKYNKLVYGYIIKKKSFELYMEIPNKYEDYSKFLKISKLVNRLNSNYIRYDGEEVKKYLDYIKFNQITNKYYYEGISFSEKEIKSINEYNKMCIIYNKIQKDIILYIKNIKIDESINNSIMYSSLENTLSFNDNNFVFSWDEFFKKIKYKHFRELVSDISKLSSIGNTNNLKNDEIFQYVYEFTTKNNLLFLNLIVDHYKESAAYYGSYNSELLENIGNQIGISEYVNIINNIDVIFQKIKKQDVNPSNIAEIIKISNLNIYSDNRDVALLGENIIDKLNKYKGYTSYERTEIINKAVDLFSCMVKRTKSTVPYVSGESSNYKYSTFDHLDENLLLAGITMDSCFRVDGNDNDFLHYCALDKNGIVIKITDEYDNLVGRAAGFRNGNCVFFNQLRTVNDEGGTGYVGRHKTEQNQIKRAFELACEEIVDKSQNNPKEDTKIDYVFITKSYAYEHEDPLRMIPEEIEGKIGYKPMDNKSIDWDVFLDVTPNLSECHDSNYFYTDYGSYHVICLASSKPLESRDNIKKENVNACYERKRSDILVGCLDNDNLRKVNKINALNSIHDQCTNYMEISEDPKQIAIIGDNWYIILNDEKEITNECCLYFDEKAKSEYIPIKNKLSLSIDKDAFNLKKLILKEQ